MRVLASVLGATFFATTGNCAVIFNGNKYTESPVLKTLVVGAGKLATFQTKFVFSQINNSTGTKHFEVHENDNLHDIVSAKIWPNAFQPRLSADDGNFQVPFDQIKEHKVYTITWKLRIPETAQSGQYVGLNYTSGFVGDDGQGLDDFYTWYVLVK